MSDRHPIFGPMPFVAVLMAAIVGAVETIVRILQLPFWGGFGFYERSEVYLLLGFDPLLFHFHVKMASIFDIGFGLFDGKPITLLTYPWIHTGFVPALFSMVFILCIGSLLSRLIPQWIIAAIFCVSSMIGGMIYVTHPDPAIFLIGSSPGYLGMLGLLAGLFLMEYGRKVPIITPALVGFPFLFIGLKIVQDVIFGPSGYWVANSTGFLVGLLISLFGIPHGRLFMTAGIKRLFGD